MLEPMASCFQKPERAFERAIEFIRVGEKDAALEVLLDVIESATHRSWRKIHDAILWNYLFLCVDLERDEHARIGLYKYKSICKQVYIESFKKVVSYFLKLSDQMADDAQNQSIKQGTIQDLNSWQTPDGTLLESSFSQDLKAGSTRVQFLWKAYRHVLKLLRNNNRVEMLYHDTAQKAFRFCLKYTQRANFCKLCGLIKKHLREVEKFQGRPTGIHLNNPLSLELALGTWLFKLKSAILFELWQQAFYAIEGIDYLMRLSKHPPEPDIMADYYESIALVFLKGNHYRFHAAALFRLFALIKDRKKPVTLDELQKIASKVLLATLAVPVQTGQSAMERYSVCRSTNHEREKHLATLCGLTHVPSRKDLVKELGSILPYVSDELKELYISLEEKFQPSQLCKKVHVALLPLQEVDDLKPYLPLIQKIATVRMLKQVSQIYETMAFGQLLAMVPYATECGLERVIVESVKNGDMQITLDHRQKSLTFGCALGVAIKEVPEGPHLQATSSEMLRSQLVSFSQALSAVLSMIVSDGGEQDRQYDQIVQRYLRSERQEHSSILNRKYAIEQRIEKMENARSEQVLSKEGHCVVPFADKNFADSGMALANGRELFNKKVNASWTVNSGEDGATEVIGKFATIYVGNLDEKIDDNTLEKFFQSCGDVLSAKVVREPRSGVSKGFGFVSFSCKKGARKAIRTLNGAQLGARLIKTCRASKNGDSGQRQNMMNYDAVYQAASDNNCTVYVGHLPSGISNDLLRQHFSMYGKIVGTSIFVDKGFAFITFDSHGAATTAIVKANGSSLRGSYLKCWWCKDGARSANNVGGTMPPSYDSKHAPACQDIGGMQLNRPNSQGLQKMTMQ